MSSEDTLLRTLLIVVVAVLLIPFLLMVFMMPMMGAWGGHMWGGAAGDGTGTAWMWLLTWLVVLAVVVGLGYLLYKAIRRPDGGETDAAIEELRIAYARGELSDEEFEERRDRLREGR